MGDPNHYKNGQMILANKESRRQEKQQNQIKTTNITGQ